MPLRERFITKSLKFATSDTPVQYVKGVGPRLGAVFQSRGITSVRDLLTFFPRAYEDRTRFKQVAELEEGLKSTVSVRILSTRKIGMRSGRAMLETRCTDDSGTLFLKWFHPPKGLEPRLTPGVQLIVTGIVKSYLGKFEMIHPELNWNKTSDLSSENGDLHVGRIVPIYTELEGIPSRTFRKVLWEAIQKFGSSLPEDIPAYLLKKYNLPTSLAAIRQIHFPEDSSNVQDLLEFKTNWHARLIYEEFFKFEYLVLQQRLGAESENSPTIGRTNGQKASRDLQVLLPFQLTKDQDQALSEILADLEKSHPMNRLVQGDVGSGKTVVAFLSAAAATAEGFQVAFMCPTEILAEQHLKSADRLLEGKISTEILTGKTTESERKRIISRLSSGEPLLLIGTHALLEEPVRFYNLGLTIIDEQHRFGVEQRRALRNKRTDGVPHSLLLTATPIPRTLALTAYGDLSTTLIRELPPGRTPIRTEVIDTQSRSQAYEKIRKELQAGHQVYFIYPLIQDSEAEGFTNLKSAISEYETLAQSIFPQFSVGLLHGQMKADEKTKIMESFKTGKVHVLVSTTVVEVGVDVPNATVMVIEHAERFGLSQLHQLRGRVGRGAAQSYCFLLSHPRVSEQTSERLKVLERTSDGFDIAEADLKLRGPGEFLGTRQSGVLPFRMADLVRDQEWLFAAREDVLAILRNDPHVRHPDHAPFRKFLDNEGRLQGERLKTS